VFDPDEYDLVISTKAWQWQEEMWDYFDIALKGARKLWTKREKSFPP